MSILEQYAQLKVEAKTIAAKLKELEPQVLDKVLEVDGEKVSTSYGTFSATARKIWKYSEELTKKESDVKEMLKLKKREEELKEIATLEAVRSTLRFQATKN